MRTVHRAALALALAAAFAAPALAQDRAPFSVGFWGDMPYKSGNDQPFIPALIADINASDIAFSMYDGDIKDGSTECVDQIYTDAIAMFDSLEKPVVYVPGDNEWTDCHRTNNGGWNNLERLDHIRKTMFDRTTSYGKETMPLQQQGKPGEAYAENTRFEHNGILFVGLNVPGSNNNKVNSEKACTKKSERTAADCEADNAEYAERNAKNLEWLKAAFETARANGDAGVVIVIQGDPGFDIPETEDDDESRLPGNDGYADFLDTLIAEAQAFDGQILLVHGDTHFFKIDKPLKNYKHMVPNITRLQTFGSPQVHWVKVTINPNSRSVFSFVPMIVPANANKTAAD